MSQAVVKRFFAEKNFGFLKNPEGGKDIFFRATGERDTLPIDASKIKEGQVVEILSLAETNKGPRATKWRLA